MAINKEFYTDTKVAKAHMVFLLLVTLSMLSKDLVSASQSIACIFIAISLPVLALSLTLMPEHNMELRYLSRKQCLWGMGTLVVGHASGLISTAIIFYSLNKFACFIFVLLTLTSTFVFMIYVFRTLDKEDMEFYEECLGKDIADQVRTCCHYDENS